MKKLVLVAFLIFLSSCSSIAPINNITKSPRPSIIFSPTSTSPPPTPSATFTISPSLTPSIMPPITATATITPTPLPSLPPLPTLERSAEDAEIKWLMISNNGCRLPCWWGIIPGKTSFPEAVQFLERLGGFIDPSNYRDSSSVEDRYLLYLHNPGTDDSFGAHIGVVNGIINSFRLDGDITRNSFQINQVLDDYGTPTDVLIREGYYLSEEDKLYGNYHVYEVVLIYKNKQFLAWYSFGAENFVEPYLACSTNRPHIEIWSPSENRSTNWIQENLDYFNKNPFFLIEEVSSYTPSSFRAQLLMTKNNPCFDIDFGAIRSKTLGINLSDLVETPTITPSPTPVIQYPFMPTYSVQESVAQYISLYNNPECPTPCWWGIIPGDTTMQEVHEILGSFSEPIRVTDNYYQDDNDQPYLSSFAVWSTEVNGLEAVWSVWSKNEITTIVEFSGAEGIMPISQVFGDYGKPDEIWLRILIPIFSIAEEDNLFLGLYYQEERAFFWYLMDAYIDQDYLYSCGMDLWSLDQWSEEVNINKIDSLERQFYGRSGDFDRSTLDNITTWTIDLFYKYYKNKGNVDVCLSGPIDY